MGYLKHGFFLSFFFLLMKNDFDDKDYFQKCLYETIKLGGDTDTNADIVCGMIGALLGKNKIPVYMI